LRVFDAFGGTFAVVLGLKTVKFAFGVEAFFDEARFLVPYRRTAARDLTDSTEFRDLRFATIATADAVATVDGPPREKRLFEEIIVE
jgi:hypothetical protein